MPKDIDIEVTSAQEREATARAVATAERRARDAEDQLGVEREGQRAAMRRAGDAIRYSPALYPWMRAYAEWLTLECVEPPKWSQKTKKARGLARAPLAERHLRLLEARPDFVQYVNALTLGPLERARKQFEAAFPTYVEAHHEALSAARDANDYAAVARIAEPVLDRVLPKKMEGVAAANVTVVLAPEQVKAIATYEAPAMLVESVADVVKE